MVKPAGASPAASQSVIAVAGAIWSVFAGFRSGRGVGTGVGTMLVIQPLAVVLAAPVFIGVILLTRYVSLGSIVAGFAPNEGLVELVRAFVADDLEATRRDRGM